MKSEFFYSWTKLSIDILVLFKTFFLILIFILRHFQSHVFIFAYYKIITKYITKYIIGLFVSNLTYRLKKQLFIFQATTEMMMGKNFV